MLRYFYGFKPEDAAKEPGIYFELKLFTVAGKHDVPQLTARSASKVRDWLDDHVKDNTFPQSRCGYLRQGASPRRGAASGGEVDMSSELGGADEEEGVQGDVAGSAGAVVGSIEGDCG